MKTSRKWLTAVLGGALVLAASAGLVSGQEQSPKSDVSSVERVLRLFEFEVSGGCEIKCANGQCKCISYDASIVTAVSSADARRIVEGALRLKAYNEGGTPIEGSFRITVKLK